MSKVTRGSSRLMGMGRFAVITRVLLKHGLGNMVECFLNKPESIAKGPEDETLLFASGFPSPERIRLVLEELGPSFIKLGQLMSTRADMFPPNYIEEFKRLQDQAPPVPFEEIEKVIEQQSSRTLSEIYKEFNPEPIAAASVAQVHPALLFSGEKVAVKVIRPGIAATIQKDIGLMYYFAGKIQRRSKIGRVLRPVGLIKEFERVIFKELDMFIEAGRPYP